MSHCKSILIKAKVTSSLFWCGLLIPWQLWKCVDGSAHFMRCRCFFICIDLSLFKKNYLSDTMYWHKTFIVTFIEPIELDFCHLNKLVSQKLHLLGHLCTKSSNRPRVKPCDTPHIRIHFLYAIKLYYFFFTFYRNNSAVIFLTSPGMPCLYMYYSFT